MIRYVVNRLLLAIPTLFGMLTMVFVLVRLVPGDPAMVILGDQASQAALAALRSQLGLDQPIGMQYLHFISNVLHGDLGRSMSSGRPVVQEMLNVLPYTLELTFSSILIGSIFGIPLGIISALHRNCFIDYFSRLFSLTWLSFPSFVTGILLLLVFSIGLGWLPVISSASSDPVTHLRNLVLPAVTLGLLASSYITRVTRSSMLEVLGEDYIRTARAKGVRTRALIVRHGLRNALIPIVTFVGLYFGTLIGNSVMTEIVFSRPGLGKLILGALRSRDYTLLQGLMICFAFFVVIVNIITDLVYSLIDPRVSYSE